MTDDYPVLDSRVIGETQIIDPTQPGQLAIVPPESQVDIVHGVFQNLPARKQTDEAIQALFMCLVQAPNDFADIARRHNVGSIPITVNRQVYNQQQYHQDTYDQGHYYQPQFSPTVAPNFSPTIEVKPYINIDTNALATSRSYQDNSGGDNRFWQIVFIGIFGLAFISLLGGD
ncbi:hypothetical protein Lepto7375DRAFT_7220 [Leptolyngbya sp. PCC 7375]|nr:hypothetical protein Lepto7375DRAFT_7220 [Leptolyngbya sp. PCC 7375]